MNKQFALKTKAVHLFSPSGLRWTSKETAMRTSHLDEDAGENQGFGATPSLTRVWTLGRLEAGSFYFHVLQHNIVYKMELIWSDDIMGETALDGNIAPPFLPRRGHSTRTHSVQRQTRAESLWGPRCSGHLGAIGSKWHPDVLSMTMQALIPKVLDGGTPQAVCGGGSRAPSFSGGPGHLHVQMEKSVTAHMSANTPRCRTN